jgi:hypothetical protein
MGWREEIVAVVENDEETIIKIGMGCLVIHCAVLLEPGIGYGEKGGEVLQAILRTLNADLGYNGIFIMPTDEDLAGTASRGRESGQGILGPEDGSEKKAENERACGLMHR